MNILDILDREGLRIATDDKRLLAFFIDEIIIGLIIFAGFYEQISSLNGDMAKIQSLLSNAFLYIIILAEMLLYIPLLIAFAEPFRRAMHDLLVKTIVIDVSAPQELDY